MSDAGTQLRAYFDEVVERVTEDDIRVRATTERGIPLRTPRFQLRPTAAVAIGFGIAMTILGAVFATDAWFVPDATEVGGNGVASSPGIAERGSPWLLVLLMLGFGLLAFGMWSARRSAGDVRERGEGNMQTIERSEAAHESSGDVKLKKRNRALTWLIAFLAVAVIGLGAWLVVELSSSGDTGTLPSDAQAVFDDYLEAWETNDSEVFRATTAEEYTFTSNGMEASKLSQSIMIGRPGHFAIDLYSTHVTGDGPYYVGQPSAVQTIPNGPWYEGQSIFELQEIDGVWKVASHYWLGDL